MAEPQLSGGMVRKGQARALSPEQVAGADQPIDGQGRGDAPELSVVSPAPRKPPEPPTLPRPAPPAAAPSPFKLAPHGEQPKVQVSARISPELAGGLKIMCTLKRKPQHEVIAALIERGLNEWNPEWRSIVAEE